MRLPHICLKYLPLLLKGMNSGAHRVQSSLGIGSLPLFRCQQQPQRHCHDCQQEEQDPQAKIQRPQLNKLTRGEIELNAH